MFSPPMFWLFTLSRLPGQNISSEDILQEQLNPAERFLRRVKVPQKLINNNTTINGKTVKKSKVNTILIQTKKNKKIEKMNDMQNFREIPSLDCNLNIISVILLMTTLAE